MSGSEWAIAGGAILVWLVTLFCWLTTVRVLNESLKFERSWTRKWRDEAYRVARLYDALREQERS